MDFVVLSNRAAKNIYFWQVLCQTKKDFSDGFFILTNFAPIFSVVVPLFNRSETIGATINSIAADAPENLDLIIVDDGSTDNSAQVAADAVAQAGLKHALIVRQDNSGPGHARNRGAALSRARYIAFLDSDDCWAPGTAALLNDLLVDKAPAELLFLATQDIPSGGSMSLAPVQSNLVVAQTFSSFSKAALSRASTRLASCNVVISQDLLAALGGFRADMPCSEDTDLFLRADDKPCTLITQPTIVAHAVGHDAQLTGDLAKVRRGLDMMLRQSRKGAYPGGAAMRKVLANSVAHVIRRAFAAGHVGLAYKLYFRHLLRMITAGNWHWAMRLPFIPVLHVIRPANFAFRWAPSGQANASVHFKGTND